MTTTPIAVTVGTLDTRRKHKGPNVAAVTMMAALSHQKRRLVTRIFRSAADLETKPTYSETKCADSETKQTDSETKKLQFGNQDSEAKATDSET